MRPRSKGDVIKFPFLKKGGQGGFDGTDGMDRIDGKDR